jgi:hypothetical protein
MDIIDLRHKIKAKTLTRHDCNSNVSNIDPPSVFFYNWVAKAH